MLRFGMAGLLLVPGISKFLTYEESVRFFRALDIPSPELLVLVVGALELVAVALLILDRVPWIGALAVVPIVAVAAVAAGPTWQNLGILGAALVLVALDARRVGGTDDGA